MRKNRKDSSLALPAIGFKMGDIFEQGSAGSIGDFNRSTQLKRTGEKEEPYG